MKSSVFDAASDAAVKQVIATAVRRRTGREVRAQREHFGGRLMIDTLEMRRMLTVLSNSTALPGTLAALTTNGANVTGEINAIHDKVFAATDKLPLIGSAIANAAGTATDSLRLLGTQIVTNALNTLSGTITGSSIQTKFAAVFGSSGLNILPGANLSVVIEDTTGGNIPNQATINLEFVGNLFSAALHPNFDLGLPGVGLAVNGTLSANLTYDVKVKLVVNTAQGFYVDLSANPEASLTLAITAPGLSATGTLGFFQLTATEGTAAGATSLVGIIGLDLSTGGNNQLTGGNLGLLVGNSKLNASAQANVHLHTNLSFAGNTNFPNISADFDMTWALANASLGADSKGKIGITSSVFGAKPDIRFNNIQLDLGSFFTKFLAPVVQKVQNALAPIQPVIDILNKPAPVFNDLHLADLNNDGTTTVLEVISSFSGLVSPAAVKFIDTVVAANAFINSIPTSGVNIMLPLGSFQVGGGTATSSTTDLRGGTTTLATASRTTQTANNTTTVLQSSGNANVVNFMNKLNAPALAGGPKAEDGAGFKIPLLTQPAMVFDLILGKNVDLFTFDTPTLNFGPSFSFSVAPISFLPFLKVKFSGGANFKAHLSMGYDTAGLVKFKNNNFAPSSAADLLDGFYIIDDPKKTFASASITLSVGLGLDIGIASAYVTGGITGTVTFTVADPNQATDGGKFRASAIASVLTTTQNPLALFNINGTISASLKLEATLLFIPYEYTIGTIQLASFAISPSTAPTPPSLGSVDASGNLNLNIGGGTQNFLVTSGGVVGGFETVYVNANGLTQTFTGVKKIVGVCGSGNDTITVQTSSPAVITGGIGNETILIGPNQNATVTGGSGNDYIGALSPTATSTGSLRFFGMGGKDTLVSGMGNDSLDGGDQDDLLRGGGGVDTLNGGNGNDTLNGGLATGSGVESLFGGSGNDTYLADNANTALGLPQWIYAGSGKNNISIDRSDVIMTAGPLDTIINQGTTTKKDGVVQTAPTLLTSRVNLPTLTVNYTGSSFATQYLNGSSAVDNASGQPLAGAKGKPTITYSGPLGKNDPLEAGTYTVTGYTPGDSLHGPATTTIIGAIVINPVNATITTVDATASFDGKPHAANVTATGPAGQNLSSQISVSYKNLADNSISTVAPTQVGMYKVLVTFTGNRNYVSLSEFDTGKTLTIGTFFGTPVPTISDSTPYGPILFDVNGDGIKDLISEGITTTTPIQTTLKVYLGNGNGTFQAVRVSNIPLNSGQYFVLSNLTARNTSAFGDSDGDGKVDIVAQTFSPTDTSNGVITMHGNGDGTFTSNGGITRTEGMTAFTGADFNNDGRTDFAYAYTFSDLGYYDRIAVNRASAGGGFSYQEVVVGVYPRGMASGDFNGDGQSDLIVSDSKGTGSLMSNGSNFFPITYFNTTSTSVLATADLNNDGKLDVLVSDLSGITAYLGYGNGNFQEGIPVTTNPVGSNVGQVVLGDYNGDGTQDIATFTTATGSSTASSFSVLCGNGDGTFGTPLVYNTNVQVLAAADLNADGSTDLVIQTGTGFSVLLNTVPKLSVNVHIFDNNYIYDGNSHGVAALTTGLNNLNLNQFLRITFVDTATGFTTLLSPTAVGKYALLASIVGDTRYNTVSQFDTGEFLTISPAAVNFSFTNVNVAYDGTPHELTASAIGVKGESLKDGLQLQYQNPIDGSISLTPPTLPGTYSVFATYPGSANYAYAPLFDTGKTVVITGSLPLPRSSTTILGDGFSKSGGPYGSTQYNNGASVAGNQPGIANLPNATYNYYTTNAGYPGGTIATGIGNSGGSVTVGPQSNLTASLRNTNNVSEATFLTVSADIRMNTLAGTDLLSRGVGLGFSASVPTGFNGPNPINNGIILNAATGSLYFSGSNGSSITAVPGGTYNAALLGAWNLNRFYTLSYTISLISGQIFSITLSNSTGAQVVSSPGSIPGFVGGTGSGSSTANFINVSSNGNDGSAFGYVDNLSVSIVAAPAITSAGPTAMTTNSATLNGSVNANGSFTQTQFQYSTDPTFTPTVQTNIATGLLQPKGVAVDAGGNVYVASQGSSNIKEILPNGTIATLGFGFNSPYAVAVNNIGEVFVADFGNNAVKKIERGGNIVTLGFGFSGPAGIAVDAAGNVYVSDSGNNAVKKILTDGTIVTIGSGFSNPQGLAIDTAGNLIVADYGNNVVKEVLTSGTILTFDYGFAGPVGVAIDGLGNILVADTSNNRIVQIAPGGTTKTLGSGFNLPIGIAVDPAGNVFIGDYGNGRAVKLAVPTIAATPGSQSGSTATNFSASLGGLSQNTAYFYRAIGQGDGGFSIGTTNGFILAPASNAGVVSVTVPTLNLAPGATFVVGTATSRSNRTVMVVNNLSISAGAKLDLGGNDMIVRSISVTGQAQTLVAINALLGTGYNGGNWNGAGIASTAAQNDANHQTSLGASAVTVAGTFDGQSVSATDVIVKYTLRGDANLDGTVNFDDLIALAQNYNKTSTDWSLGDFNYDGTTNFDDLIPLAQNYNKIFAAGAVIGVVPTPAAVAVTKTPVVKPVVKPSTAAAAATAVASEPRRKQKTSLVID